MIIYKKDFIFNFIKLLKNCYDNSENNLIIFSQNHSTSFENRLIFIYILLSFILSSIN